jgi:hypothetical protein
MSSPRTADRRIQAPVHEHRDWRHLQRAAVAAHKQLGNVAQANFCALFVPAASIALWILQHAPLLARQDRLHILVAHATEYQALDGGRWLNFIPWLLGRPEMQLQLSVVGALGLPESVGLPESGFHPDAAESESELQARLDHRFQSVACGSVRSMAPAELHVGTVKSWSELGGPCAPGGTPRLPDICAVFSPNFSVTCPELLSETGLLPLLRARVPLALFSSSEAGQLVDVYVLAAAGIELEDPDCWPNPWELPTQKITTPRGATPGSTTHGSTTPGGTQSGTAQNEAVFARMAWSATSSHVADGAYPDQRLLQDLGAVLFYIDASTETAQHGPDVVLTLGEVLRAAPLSGSNSEVVSELLRLPYDTAVDSASGHIYQLQDNRALLLDVNPVPASILEAFPGDEHLLLRAIWATSVHRDYVRPHVNGVDAALLSHFAALDEVATISNAQSL